MNGSAYNVHLTLCGKVGNFRQKSCAMHTHNAQPIGFVLKLFWWGSRCIYRYIDSIYIYFSYIFIIVIFLTRESHTCCVRTFAQSTEAEPFALQTIRWLDNIGGKFSGNGIQKWERYVRLCIALHSSLILVAYEDRCAVVVWTSTIKRTLLVINCSHWCMLERCLQLGWLFSQIWWIK